MVIRVLIFFGLVAVGCSRFKPASYVLDHPTAIVKLNLMADSTFHYYLRHELAESISAGTWSYYNDTVRLLSYDSFGSKNGNVKEIHSDKSFFELQFLNDDCTEPYSNLEILFNGFKKLTTNSRGIIVTTEPVKTVDLMILDTYPFHYRVKDSSAKKFEICLTMVSSVEKYFVNEPFRYTRGKLIDRFGIPLERE